MSRSPYANVFFYFRGPSPLGMDTVTVPQLENNTTKALVNLLEHAEPAVVVSWLGRLGIDVAVDAPVETFVQGGPARVDAPIRRLVVITAGQGPNDASWDVSPAQRGRVDAAVYVPGAALAIVESKVGAGVEGGQLDKHAADWGIARPEDLSAHDLPDSWVITTWGELHQWALSLANGGSVGEVSRFLLSQFAEYLELIDVTPFAGFREDDFAFLAERRSAVPAGGPTELSSDPLQGERLKDRLYKLWEAIRASLPEDEQDTFGLVHVGALRSVDDRVSAQTNREEREAVNLTFELDPERLELDLVAWTAPQVLRFEAWLAHEGATMLSQLDGWELVIWKRRAMKGKSGNPFWQPEQRAIELDRLRLAEAPHLLDRLADYRSALEPGWELLAYHLRNSWPRDDVIASGRAIADDAMIALREITPILASINSSATRPVLLNKLVPSNRQPLTLASMGFVIRDDCDQTPTKWGFVAAGTPFLVPSPNGMHLRGIRHYIAATDTAEDSDYRFIACTITKSYASGGSDGSLDIIGTASPLAEAVARANRRLRDWITDDAVYLDQLQRNNPEPLDATNIESAMANGEALFVSNWSDVDDKAAFRYRGPDVLWAVPGEPVILYYEPTAT